MLEGYYSNIIILFCRRYWRSSHGWAKFFGYQRRFVGTVQVRNNGRICWRQIYIGYWPNFGVPCKYVSSVTMI